MSRPQSGVFEYTALRHAWLNLLDKRMTTGRINQVSTVKPRHRGRESSQRRKFRVITVRSEKHTDDSEISSAGGRLTRIPPLSVAPKDCQWLLWANCPPGKAMRAHTHKVHRRRAVADGRPDHYSPTQPRRAFATWLSPHTIPTGYQC